MPSILSEDDKEIVKRQVPKSSNKIQAVAVARLYIAYPNRSKWTYTGLQGAAVLANDLVGNTYWIKLVDVSPANRGVIWDQEIYENFPYNQDRTFFHTFETEDCLAGLSFADEKEAKTFLKKMADREKNASKATRANAFGSKPPQQASHGRGILGGLFGGHRHSSAPSFQSPTPPESPRTYAPPRDRLSAGSVNGGKSEYAALDALDPNWRETWGAEIRSMGITDEQVRENQEFIADYIREQQATTLLANGIANNAGRAPPPPPPPAAPRTRSDSPQNGAPTPPPPRRGGAAPAPPAPPAPRRSKADSIVREPTPPREPSPPRGPPPPRFVAPPPIPDAGKYANTNGPTPPSRNHAASLSNPGPPPPPRPPKTAIDDDYEPGATGSKFGVPPPFMGARAPAPPPTPSRGPVPPPPPARSPEATQTSFHPGARSPETKQNGFHAVAPPSIPPPPLPPKTPHASNPPAGSPLPPPLPPTVARAVPPGPPSAPPLPPSLGAPQSSAPPLPPLPPSFSSGPPAPPPPPPPSSSAGPPAPPPPPPNRDSGYASGVPAPALSSAPGDRGGLLAGIHAAGGISSLKKVDRSQVRDRSAAMVPGTDTGPAGSGLPPAGNSSGGGGGGLADALKNALDKRKQKVSGSDDEAENDDWD